MAARSHKRLFGFRRERQEPLCHAHTVEELTQQNVETISRMQEYSNSTRTVGCEHHHIPMEDRTAIDLLTRKTKPEQLVEQIEKSVK